MADLLPRDLKPGSPEWFVWRLEKKLDDRRQELQKYEDYYSGKHRLKFSSPQFKRVFGGMFDEWNDNWCELIVDASAERLHVNGFRFSSDPQDRRTDDDAWRFWQENQLDAESEIGFTEALVNSEVSLLVWGDGSEDPRPQITIEHPQQTIVAFESGTRRRLAALKKWTDDYGDKLATLYRPDGLYKFKRTGARVAGAGRWVRREVLGETWPLANPMNVVPVVPMYNRPRLLKPGVSEIANAIPTQDAVNKLCADMLVASEFAGFRQRWATGLEIPRDPETGKPIENLKAALDRLWILNPRKSGQRGEEERVQVGEFEATDLRNYVAAIEMQVQHLASRSRTPPHYFYLSGEFPSGESIKSAETGLVAKVKSKMRHFGESLEEVMRLAFLVVGETAKGKLASAETVWSDPESRTESQHVDAVTKKKDLGVPLEQLWEDLDYTPEQIKKFKAMRAEEALDIRNAFDPLATPPAPADAG